MGESNFRKGIQSYYKNHFNVNATTTDFRMEMEKTSGVDLKSYFDQWLYQAGVPKIKGEWFWNSNKKELVVTLEQMQVNAFSLPIEIGIYLNEKKELKIKKVTLTDKSMTISLPFEY